MEGTEYLYDPPPPIKTLSAESLMSCPHMLSQFGGIKCFLCDCTERSLLEAKAWFPLVPPHVAFPFADLCCILSLK